MDRAWQGTLIALQAFQLALLLVHDWIPLGEFNDIQAVRRENTLWQLLIGTTVTSIPVAIGLGLSIHYFGYSYPTGAKIWLWLTYGILFATRCGSNLVQVRLGRAAHDQNILFRHAPHDRIAVEQLGGLADRSNPRP